MAPKAKPEGNARSNATRDAAAPKAKVAAKAVAKAKGQDAPAGGAAMNAVRQSRRQDAPRSNSQTLATSSVQAERFHIDPLFIDLQSSAGCIIPRTEQRGIILQQLMLLLAHIQRRCRVEEWTDRNSRSPTHGEALLPDTINLYHVCDWVIRPATEKRQCSYVELVAGSPQQPLWFVSHWWGEAIAEFAACLNQHAQDRTLKKQAPYWVCAYANNQWKLDEDLVDDPTQSSFRQAMNLAQGTVSILDKKAVCYTRVWCCYEVYTSLMALATEVDAVAYKYDIYTTVGEQAVGIIDGFAQIDLCAEDPNDNKYEREQCFPLELIDGAFGIELQRAAATEEIDKRRILNCIVGNEHLDMEPPVEHQRYDELNSLLRGRFVATGLRKAFDAKRDTGPFLAALAESRSTKLSLSFFSCSSLTDGFVVTLSLALPPSLLELDLDLAFCYELSDNSICTLAECIPINVKRLVLSWKGCNALTDTGVCSLAEAIRNFQLHELGLSFYGIKALSNDSIEAMTKAIPESMRKLYIDFSFCHKLSDDALNFMSTSLRGSLRTLELRFRSLSFTDEGVKILAASFPESLQELKLDLGFCEDLDDKSAHSLGKSLPAGLQYLVLDCWGWKALTDDGIRAIATGLPKTILRLNLKFGQCSNLTDQSLGYIAPALNPSQEDLVLNFRHCPLLTMSGGWVPFARALPSELQRFELWINSQESRKTAEAMREILQDRSTICKFDAVDCINA